MGYIYKVTTTHPRAHTLCSQMMTRVALLALLVAVASASTHSPAALQRAVPQLTASSSNLRLRGGMISLLRQYTYSPYRVYGMVLYTMCILAERIHYSACSMWKVCVCVCVCIIGLLYT